MISPTIRGVFAEIVISLTLITISFMQQALAQSNITSTNSTNTNTTVLRNALSGPILPFLETCTDWSGHVVPCRYK